MLQQIKNELLKLGNRYEIIPVSYFESIRRDAADLMKSGFLNKYQNELASAICDFSISVQNFVVKSIIITASPSPSTVTVKFNRNGRSIPAAIPSTYTDYNSTPVMIEKVLNKLVGHAGYHVASAQELPKKWLAVRSGLAVYGRNNVCYVNGMGSFVTLNTFYSDISCIGGELHEVRQMEQCKTCRACLNSCPTAAIRPDRFIIDNERCLTYFNESDGEQPFPEWIDACAHNSIVGCTRCQLNCPVNREFINESIAAFEFTEEETAKLLSGVTFEQLTEGLAYKIDKLNLRGYLSALPRNLKALFENADIPA